MSTNSIVMWVILLDNAGWDCFKNPILREILRTQNLLRVEHCSILEVIHLFQSVGCVRNKLQFRTVQQNPKSSLIKHYEDLILKQMFDVTAQLVNNQEEIHGLDKIQWERILGNVCH